ncbi:DNA mismatch repair protein MutS [Chlamydiifrater volucris]|uniref:DNA mismatch repair protein MutS n=1 Tax=Chlamydiifrater volucris TaxID=2681470 RepID=UPI001BCFDD35|nr:DNA mismatch repair protein MutS [Chlamydiifrater volucris]
MTVEKKLTPMMEQWHNCKRKAGESLLLFRLGDFYEAFYEDAKLLADNLELTLTQRQGIPMAGIPVLHIDSYVDKLVAKGFKVAIAEQESKSSTKGPMNRDISRFITPGTLLNSSLLSEKANNYIVALDRVGSLFGLAALDISTGSFTACEYDSIKNLHEEIFRLQPKELLISEKFSQKHCDELEKIQTQVNLSISVYSDWTFDHKLAYATLTKHFKVSTLDGFGLKGAVPAVNASGGLLSYIHDKLLLPLDHVSKISSHSEKEYLSVDKASQINLELLRSSNDDIRASSLLSIMDQTLTPMGGRLLRNRIIRPFYDKNRILACQDAVEFLLYRKDLRKFLQVRLKEVRDFERLVTRVATQLATPKDLGTLKNSLSSSLEIFDKLVSYALPEFLSLPFEITETLIPLSDRLEGALLSELPLRVSEGGVFKDNYHPEIEELRNARIHAQAWVKDYQEKIRQETGKRLKVCFNNLMGYYIEASKEQASGLPSTFIRRQTRMHAERFVTEELQKFEDKTLHAEENLQALEALLFKELCEDIAKEKNAILSLAEGIARLDYVYSLATLASNENYCRPLIDNGDNLIIHKGRHPVVEQLLPSSTFIPNDTIMRGTKTRMMILTGPNMAGKSTYIRQTALLVIMAQMGSFIPAESAHIGIIDKIFTRIGAGDNLTKGMSTFMVEMAETANILHNATSRSLVILDEIGRGTSTYDGIAIAQAVIEYLLTTEGRKAKTLFATHYKELTNLEDSFPQVENFHAGINESNAQPVFLYKIIKGPSNKSFGIHVAKLAGFPLSVVARAQVLLSSMETKEDSKPRNKERSMQLTIF